MTSWAAALRRGPEEPRQVTFLDLFLDLVFVFALFQLSHGLLAHLGWSGTFQTAVLLLAVWLVWNHTARIGDRYDLRRPVIQLLVIGSMFGTFVLAVAAPEAFGTRGLVFAGVYVAVQVGRYLFLLAVTRGGERRPEARELFWFGVSALPWLAGAAAQGWARGVLWVLALAVDYTSIGLGWPAPGLGRARAEEFAISGEFVAERVRQFFIIALGELILVTGLTVTSSSGSGAGREAAVVVAFATTVLLWRIYIYRAGEVLGAAVAAAPDPLRVGISVLYAHPVMVTGLVAISVGDELVITHPAGRIQPAWIAVILGGPALFLAGRAMFEYVVFSRVSPDRVIGILVLAAVSPAMVLAPPLLAALAAAVVLAGVAIADAARARRHPDEPPSPRPGRARTAVREPSRPRNDELLAGNWIWVSNLRRFLELVSSYVGYRFDYLDWQAIQAGLDTFTSDKDTFSYPLIGRRALTLTISKDPGSDEVSVQITGHQDRLLGARIAALTDAFQ
jgi:low temperature requirement protein LtrA